MYWAVGWFIAVGLLGQSEGADPVATLLEGDYLEARTCNITVGPCHFNAEVLDRGRGATLVWHLHRGRWQGEELSGRTVVAVVTADRNLQDLGAQAPVRQAVLYLDGAATPRQRKALRDWVTSAYASELGRVKAIIVTPLRFDRCEEGGYQVTVGEALSLRASRFLCRHCTQTPYQTWYSPLIPGVEVEPGKAIRHRYKDRFLSAQWDLGEENSVFIGSFQAAGR